MASWNFFIADMTWLKLTRRRGPTPQCRCFCFEMENLIKIMICVVMKITEAAAGSYVVKVLLSVIHRTEQEHAANIPLKCEAAEIFKKNLGVSAD